MKPFFLSVLLMSVPVVVNSQSPDSEDGFQRLAFDIAQQSGSARIPVICAGLFKALRQPVDKGSKSAALLGEKEIDAALTGGLAYKKETGGTNEQAIAFINSRVSKVSIIYTKWLTFNLQSGGPALSAKISENYVYCDSSLVEWQKTQ